MAVSGTVCDRIAYIDMACTPHAQTAASMKLAYAEDTSRQTWTTMIVHQKTGLETESMLRCICSRLDEA